MPPRGVKSAKRKRQYEQIKHSYKRRGRSRRAEEIAARTVNKERRELGQTRTKKRSSRHRSTSRRRSSARSRGRSRS
jgi:hypothetical protein